MIIFCSGLKRSGSTLLYNSVRLVVLASGRPFKGLGYRHAAQLSEEFSRLESLAKSETVYLIKTHDVSYLVESGLLEGNVAFCSLRSPIGIAKSGMRMFGWRQDDAIRYLEQSSDDLRQLREADADVHLVEFEWFSQNLADLVDYVCEKLGIHLDPEVRSETTVALSNLGQEPAQPSIRRRTSRGVLDLLLRMRLHTIAQRIGVPPKVRQKFHFVLKGIDSSTLMHPGHRRGLESVEKDTTRVEQFLARRPEVLASYKVE